jgi:tetratricopeptide (TPR) repeat protein
MQALAWHRLGFTRAMTAQLPQAESDLRRSIALYEKLLAGEPHSRALRVDLAAVHSTLSFLFMRTGRMAEAVSALRAAIALKEAQAAEFPDDLEALQGLATDRTLIATWMEQSGRPADAESERRRLLGFYAGLAADAASTPARGRTLVQAYLFFCEQAAAHNWRREQVEALRQGLKLEPSNPVLLNGLAWTLALRPGPSPGQVAEAVELGEKAVAAMPDERDYWNTLGLAHLRAGHWEAATGALDRSIRLHHQGGDASDRLLMAMAWWNRGDKERAIDWYNRAVDWMSRNPTHDRDMSALRDEVEALLGRRPRK